jgi:hypothetical protein
VLSQSHEAVKTAAERILQVQRNSMIDLLRVGQHSTISLMLHKYHARAIQDRYREFFRAATKERVVAPATRLGLDKEYNDEAIEIETTLASLVRQIELCEPEIATSRTELTPDISPVCLRSGVPAHDPGIHFGRLPRGRLSNPKACLIAPSLAGNPGEDECREPQPSGRQLLPQYGFAQCSPYDSAQHQRENGRRKE